MRDGPSKELQLGMSIKKVIVGIDPGVHISHYGILDYKLNLVDCGKFPSHMSGIENFIKRIDQLRYDHIFVVEEPDKIQACVANVKDIFELVKVTERFRVISVQKKQICYLVTVKEWKGNVPKDITKKRVIKHCKNVSSNLSHHVYDAIGVALWKLNTI